MGSSVKEVLVDSEGSRDSWAMKSRRLLVVLALVACGSRTGLLVDDLVTSSDAGTDGEVIRDAEVPIDSFVPGIDASPRTDAIVRTDCPDPSTTFIYMVSSKGDLLSFYPPTNTFKTVGTISCPTTATPFSMAVDRTGVAYILYNNGFLFRVSTKTAECTATTYVSGQSNFTLFGMGFATKDLGPAEDLYVAGNSFTGGSLGLATINTTDFILRPVGSFVPAIDQAELTGTGDGRLFAFYKKEDPSGDGSLPGSFIAEIDKSTGFVLGEDKLSLLDQGQGWAFAFWGGDFYNFTGQTDTSTRVTKYNAGTKVLTDVATTSELIVGAGVSTCAPEN